MLLKNAVAKIHDPRRRIEGTVFEREVPGRTNCRLKTNDAATSNHRASTPANKKTDHQRKSLQRPASKGTRNKIGTIPPKKVIESFVAQPYHLARACSYRVTTFFQIQSISRIRRIQNRSRFAWASYVFASRCKLSCVLAAPNFGSASITCPQANRSRTLYRTPLFVTSTEATGLSCPHPTLSNRFVQHERTTLSRTHRLPSQNAKSSNSRHWIERKQDGQDTIRSGYPTTRSLPRRQNRLNFAT